MCVKIVRVKETREFDVNVPLEEQLRGSKQVVVNYEPQDLSIERFLSEVERLCKSGISASLNIQFNHNNQLSGVKVQKRLSKLAKDLDINELVKFMVGAQADADKKIEEMLNLCNTR